MMKANRRVDTKPEIALRSALHRAGLRFRKDLCVGVGGRSPRPDVVFTRVKVAVFLDGCFWHLCPEHGRVPKGNNPEYWRRKLRGNRERDAEDTASLAAEGWRVVRIWEHEQVTTAVERVLVAVAESKHQRP